jgi:son of sevenless-like protein
MSAIVTALSSIVITRLHLTWAHVGRKSTYESLSRFNDPTGNFAGYRSLMRDVEGSCIPFVIMFLTDLAHIHDQYTDDEGGRLCFFKRQRWYEVVTAMLRYQSRPYDIAENEVTMGFVTKHLRDLEEGWKDHNWFWSRSQEVQQTEMAHADIRRGLEAAGF